MYRRPSLLSDISSLAHDGSSGGSIAVDGGGWGTSPMDDVSAPRPLTPEETDELHALLKSCLKLTNCACAMQAEEDSVDLLTYAFDLIGDGETVGAVLEEMEFMELEICGPGSLEEMRVCLSSFFGRMDRGRQAQKLALERGRTASMPLPGDDDEVEYDPREAYAKYGRRNSLQSQMRRSENHVAVDLSCKTAAAKKEEEMQRLFAGGNKKSIKDRMSMYDEQGKLKSDFKEPSDAIGVEDMDGLELLDHASIDAQRRQELLDVMSNKSLTKKERDNKMGEVRAKYGLAEMRLKFAQVKTSGCSKDGVDRAANPKDSVPRAVKEMQRGQRRSSVDLSSKSAAVKKAQELKTLFGEGRSLKDRMAMYNEHGELIAKKDQEEAEEANDVEEEKSLDQLRREELMGVMKDKSLNREEKARKMEEVKQKYSAMTAPKEEQPPAETTYEQAPVRTSQENPTRRLSLDEQEREELQSVLRNRALSQHQRRRRMEQVRGEYAMRSSRELQDDESTGTVSTGTESNASTSTEVNVHIDLSAKSYKCRRRASLERLNRGGLSLKERMALYNNNEYIRAVE